MKAVDCNSVPSCRGICGRCEEIEMGFYVGEDTDTRGICRFCPRKIENFESLVCKFCHCAFDEGILVGQEILKRELSRLLTPDETVLMEEQE